MSLARRLGWFVLISLALLLAGFSTTLYLLARNHFQRGLDEHLSVVLDSLSTAAEIEADRIEWRPGLRTMPESARAGEGPVSWLVLDDAGRIIEHSWDAGRLDISGVLDTIPGGGRVRLRHVGPDGRAWRVSARRLRPALTRSAAPSAERGETGTEPLDGAEGHYSALVLAAAAPLGPVDAVLRNVMWILIGLSAALWLLAGVVGASIVRRALRPMTEMAVAARSMTAEDRDQRLPSPGTGDELEGLARSFNDLLGRLHRAIEQQRRFAGDASHQLRTPLAALLGQIEVARRRERSPYEYRQTLDHVHAEALRLQRIVEALLFLARGESDAGRPDLEPIRLDDWLPIHLQGWSSHPRFSDLRCDTARDGPLWTLAHPALLGQMLDNLVENACKYSRPGDPVEVRLGSDGGMISLSIKDQGIGIASDDLPHVFEPFYRSPWARRRGTPGEGLGLAVVQRIAVMFGGAVSASSETGRGSRFEVRLPRSPGPAAHDEPPVNQRELLTAGSPEPAGLPECP